jgi:predicted cobalt transporter CbtA
MPKQNLGTALGETRLMRMAALILGIVGGLLCGSVGIYWIADHSKKAESYEKEVAEYNDNKGEGEPSMSFMVVANEKRNAGMVLIPVMLLGILGALLTLKGEGKIGGAGLVVSALVPGILVPASLLFTSVLFVAGVLSFLVRPQEA